MRCNELLRMSRVSLAQTYRAALAVGKVQANFTAMRKRLALICFVAATAIADDGIRSFPIPTIVALGKELYRRDHMASTAFDALFAAYPKAQELPLRGWITQADKENQRVYFIQERDAHYSLAYVATFRGDAAPAIEDSQGATLPEFVAKRFLARRAAVAAIPKFMAESYNFEVLDAPDGKGFLVYGLASTKDPDEVVVGGHYRVTVSADGQVQQVDALSRSFLVLHRQSPDVPKGSGVVGLSMSHIVSNTPVETHVYVSLLHKIPLYVATSDNVVWRVSDGEITKMDDKK